MYIEMGDLILKLCDDDLGFITMANVWKMFLFTLS